MKTGPQYQKAKTRAGLQSTFKMFKKCTKEGCRVKILLKPKNKPLIMKKIIFLAVAILGFSFACKAQCSTKVRWTASKMENLDSNMNVVDSKDMNAVIETTAKDIKIDPGQGDEEVMTGTFSNITCNWNVPFKNGKTVITTDIHTSHEDLKAVIITVEAVDGKITFLLHANEYPDKLIKVYVDKYEEVK